MQFDSEGRLVVADAFKGIYRLDFKDYEVTTLVPGDYMKDGRANKLYNNLVVAKNGNIYFTVISTNFHMHEGLLEVFSGCGVPNGRIMSYNAGKKWVGTVLDKVAGANGIILSEKEDFMLYSEIYKAKVWKVWLKGEKAGEEELFANTPGLPDNITPNGKGGFFVGVPLPLDPETFDPVVDFINKYPSVQRFFLRLLYNIKSGFELINTHVWHSELLDVWIYWVANLKAIAGGLPQTGIIVEYDSQGNVLQSWHGKQVGQFSEAFKYKNNLILGSFSNKFVGVIKYE